MLEKLNREELEQRLINLPEGLQRDIVHYAIEQLRKNIQHLQNEQKSQFEALFPHLQHPALLLTQTQHQLLLETSGLTTELDALLSIKTLIKALSELQQKQQDDHSPTNHSEVYSTLQTLTVYYQDYLQQLCQSAPQSQERKNLLEPPAQLIAEGLGVYTLSQTLVRKLLCRNEQGNVVKQNETGNRAVVGYGGIHFKPNYPLLKEYLAPGVEYAMYSLHELLGGEVITPTMTLKIRQVLFQDKPGFYERTIQAGLTIDGVMLQDLLRLMQVMDLLKTKLGDCFIPALQNLINQIPLQKLLQKHPHLKTPNAKKLLEAFCGYMMGFDRNECVLDFDEWRERNAALRARKFELLAKCPEEALFTYSIIRAYPELMAQQKLALLLEIPFAIKLIKNLFPDATATKIAQEVPLLWDKFDAENFGRLCVGAFLCNPTDFKADNLMVKILRNPLTRQIEKLNIIGIDNDKSFVPPLIHGKQHKMQVKNILYFFPQMDQPIAEQLYHHLIHITPEELLMQWLISLQQQNQRYEQFLIPFLTDGEILQGRSIDQVEDASDYALRETGNIPIRLDADYVLSLYKKLKRLHQQLRSNKERPTYRKLLNILEPMVGLYYQTLQQKPGGHHPIEALQMIYDGTYSVEKIFADHSQLSLDDTLQQAHTQQIGDANHEDRRVHSIIEVVCMWVQQLDWEQLAASQNLSVDQALHLVNQLREHFATPSLSLSTQTATAWLQLAVPKGLYFATQLFLDSGADITYADDVQGWTVLHTLIRHLLELAHNEHTQSNLQFLIELLAQHPNAPLNHLDKHGCSPLHYLNVTHTTYPLVDKTLKLLLSHGADLEDINNVRQETRLERSMRRDDVLMFCLLATHGAGRKIDAKKLLEFINKHRDHPLYREKLGCAEQQLVQQNSLFAWQLCLKQIIQKTPPTPDEIRQHCPEFDPRFNYQMEGAITGKCYLPPEVAKHLFNPDGTPKRTNQYGRRPVVYFKSQDIELQAKFYPEMPAVQEAVRLLSELLFCQGVAQSELFQLTDRQNQVYPVLFSQHVPGEDLQSLFNKPDEAKQKLALLDRTCFTELLFLTLLINPEDGKPDNYVLQTVGQHYCIVGIDEDHSFVEPVLMEQGRRVAQVKTIVYCLDQMLQPLDNKVCQAFAQMDAAGLLQKWLNILQERQDYYDILFDETARKQLYHRGKRLFWQTNDLPTVIRIPFAPKSVVKIYEKMLRIQATIREENMTGLQLLKRAMPALGLLYEKAFEQADIPLKRFHYIGATAYSIAIGQRYQTLTDSKLMLSRMQIPEKAMITLQNPYTPKKALEELMLARHEELKLQAVVDAMQQGDFNSFQALFLDCNKEKIIYYFDFQHLTQMQQDTLIKILITDLSFLHLRIKNCQTLTDGQLTTLLQQSPNLQSLRLQDCPNITGRGLNRLDEYCPSLQALSLINLRQLQSLAGYQLFGTRPLVLSELHYLRLKNCDGLNFIALQAEQLHTLDVSGWRKLSNYQLARLVQGCPNLHYLQLNGCDSIIYRSLIQKLPALAGCNPRLLKYINAEMIDDVTRPITQLDFSHFACSIEDLKEIASVLERNTTVTEADLSKLKLDEKGLDILVTALAKNSHIMEVNLSGDNLPFTVTDKSLKARKENPLDKLTNKTVILDGQVYRNTKKSEAETVNSKLIPYDYIFKIVLWGGYVGKSCLLDRFANDRFLPNKPRTIGVEFYRRIISISSRRYKLLIWDTNSSERFLTVTCSYFRGADVVMVCFDVTQEATFRAVRERHQLAIQHPNKNALFFLLGLKCDLSVRRAITCEQGTELANELGMVGYYECSAKNNINIDAVFYEAATCVIKSDFFRSSVSKKDPYLTDSNGNNALHFAAEKGDVILANELLKLNIHVGIKNNEGKTALDIAIEKKNQAVVTAINNHIHIGASPHVKNITFFSTKQSLNQVNSPEETQTNNPNKPSGDFTASTLTVGSKSFH